MRENRMRILAVATLLLLAVPLVGGCDVSTAPVDPAAAQSNPPQEDLLSFLGLLDDGGSFQVFLAQEGMQVNGRGLLSRGGQDVPVQASGTFVDGKTSLQLFPDDAAPDTDIFSVRGDVGGQGTWFDSVTQATGQLTLQAVPEPDPQPQPLGRLLDGVPYEAQRPEAFDITCTGDTPDGPQTYRFRVELSRYENRFFEGTFTCDRPVGEYDGHQQTSGSASAIRFSPPLNARGSLAMRVEPYYGRAAFLLFTIPQDRVGASSPLDSDSVVSDGGRDIRVTGTITVVDRGIDG